jgi:Helix-turn-helix domain
MIIRKTGKHQVNLPYGYTDNWLLPTGEQERLLRQWAGMSRFVWNGASVWR